MEGNSSVTILLIPCIKAFSLSNIYYNLDIRTSFKALALRIYCRDTGYLQLHDRLMILAIFAPDHGLAALHMHYNGHTLDRLEIYCT